MVKTNSRGFNRSQVPNSLPRQEDGQIIKQNNNIGVIQNFNQYHIELKNLAGQPQGSQQKNTSGYSHA